MILRGLVSNYKRDNAPSKGGYSNPPISESLPNQ